MIIFITLEPLRMTLLRQRLTTTTMLFLKATLHIVYSLHIASLTITMLIWLEEQQMCQTVNDTSMIRA
jgi:hypothetical protein